MIQSCRLRLLEVLALSILQGLVFSENYTLAQSNIVPDDTLGEERSQVIPLDGDGLAVDRISGGAVRDSNLFHSFREFNVSAGRGAYFFSPNAEIQNILARVTGGNPSEILGILGTRMLNDSASEPSNANLFLINPNGIIFGSDARLDVGGSFVTTTANAIQFGEQGLFSATNPEPPQLLTVNPSSFLFNQIAAQPINSIESRASLTVPTNRSLLLIGGNTFPNAGSTGKIVLNGGRLRAPGGRVEIGGLGESGKIDLNINGSDLSLDFSEGIERADVSLLNSSEIDVTGSGSDVTIYAQKLNIIDDSDICAGIGADVACGGLGSDFGSVDSQAGDIKLTATEQITIDNNSGIYNSVNKGAVGTGGDIVLDAKQISIQNDGQVQAVVDGEGNTGNILLQAQNSIEVKSKSFLTNLVNLGTGKAGNFTINTPNLTLSDEATITNETRGVGNTGDLTVNTERLSLDNSSISINVRGKGNAGTLTIRASDFINLSGEILTSEGDPFSPGGFQNQVDLTGEGEGGDLLVETPRLSISNGSKVQVATFRIGNFGKLLIQASQVDVFNTPDAKNKFITGIFAGILQDPRSQVLPTSERGNLIIDTERLSIRGGAEVSADTSGVGDGGNISITARDFVEVVGSSRFDKPSFLGAEVNPPRPETPITPEAITGDGGNLTIKTRQLSIREGGKVSVSTFGKGNAGNILVQAGDLVEVVGISPDGGSRSSLFAQVETEATGNGGDLRIETGKLSVRDDARVSVNSFGQGNAGNLTIMTEQLLVEGGGEVQAITFADGNAGSLIVKAADLLQLSGKYTEDGFPYGGLFASAIGGSGDGGDLTIETDRLILLDGATVGVSNFQTTNRLPPGSGSPGNLNITAGSILLNNQATLTAATAVGSQQGRGNIFINARDTLEANNSKISTTSQQSSGGAINIIAKDIRLFGDSDITTNVFSGAGGGGNITLSANTIIALDDSDILSFAGDGKGGDITFNTAGFFSTPLYHPTPPTTNAEALNALDGNNRVDVNASGTVSGSISGVPDTTFIQNSLSELPDTQIDTNALLANSCIAQTSQQEGTFFITGSSSLPIRPGDAPLSSYTTGTVRSITTSATPHRPWKIGDPVVEPQGVYQLTNGQLVLSRKCR
ncbi:MAG: filamentous hemagglutinin N-terminal domain-containing protein [Scytonema sp. PMC 1070.18]|nr:filamentous hemagglutinin N-terminal domain-containing protein [Scytonema sp. PMC 1070.18]